MTVYFPIPYNMHITVSCNFILLQIFKDGDLAGVVQPTDYQKDFTFTATEFTLQQIPGSPFLSDCWQILFNAKYIAVNPSCNYETVLFFNNFHNFHTILCFVCSSRFLVEQF